MFGPRLMHRLFCPHKPGLAVAIYLLATSLAVIPAQGANANELDALHRQVVLHPGNVELNLRFAQLAETSGQLRWALSAYERIAINHPNHAEAQRGLLRVRRALQPNTTLLTLQFGAQYESNPRYYLPPRRGEVQGIGSAMLYDERGVNGMRWRTNAQAAGIVHQRENDLNFAIAGVETGPVMDLLPGWSLHPALGGNVSYFSDHFYYGEGTASATFESAQYGIYRALVVRGGYRSYNNFFPSGEGGYVEARGRLVVPNALSSGIGVAFSPWLVWSDINGSATVVNPINTTLQPGAYLEWGGKLDFVRTLAQGVIGGLHIAASDRDYRTDIVVTSGAKRRDTTVIPAASLTLPNLFAAQSGLRFEYRYIWNDSNDPTKKFNDHIVNASFVTRFDPTGTGGGPVGTAARR